MNLITRYTTFLAALLALAGVAGPAGAGPIVPGESASVTITFDNPIFSAGYDGVRIYYPGETVTGVSSASVAAGRFTGTASNLINISPEIFPDGVDDVFMYCYDLYNAISSGSEVNYIVRFGAVMERTLKFIGAVNRVLNEDRGTMAPSDFDVYAWTRPVKPGQSSAVQLGLWESKYESGLDWSLDVGSFKATRVDVNTAEWLTLFFAGARDSATAPVGQQFTMLFENPDFQDMITADPPAAEGVPAPASLGLLLLGALILRGRRGLSTETPAFLPAR